MARQRTQSELAIFFLQSSSTGAVIRKIANAATFKTAKQNAEHYVKGLEEIFKGGSQTFINKGTNGRWRDVLTDDDLKLYEATFARELSPDCACWLETGRLDDA